MRDPQQMNQSTRGGAEEVRTPKPARSTGLIWSVLYGIGAALGVLWSVSDYLEEPGREWRKERPRW